MMRRWLCGLLVVAASLACASGAVAAPIELSSLEVKAVNQNGTPDVQAGSHPFALVTSFQLGEPEEFARGRERVRGGGLKDVRAELPPGFVGNPNATPRCPYKDFSVPGQSQCPNDTAIGEADTRLAVGNNSIEDFTSVVYNVEQPGGVSAEFGYRVFNLVPVFLDASVRTGGDYGITVNVRNLTEVEDILGSKVTIWGVPADHSHDLVRGNCLEESSSYEGPVENVSLGDCPVDIPVEPLLTNPTSCGSSRTATMSVDSWTEPGRFASKSVVMPELFGCEKLDFSPTLTVTPDGTGGSTPTGLNVDLHVPQEATTNPVGFAEADVKNTKVALPVGVQISPSAADGLLACSEAQISLHSPHAPTCPDASKVATVEIDTPLLPTPLTGAAYLATQDANPFGSLIALYVVAENPTYGVLIKVAGQVTPDPVTGQLVTTFNETPPLPFTDFKLDFFGTSRAPLTTPPLCGTYTTETAIEPWSGTPAVHPSSKFQITTGPNGSACTDPLPFNPGFQTGSLNLQAGAFTPYTLTMNHPDGDQTLSRVEMQMPPGLLGTLANVKLCGEPQAAQGTCGEDSLIGHTIVSAGLGNDPYTVTGGKVFITTGYKGAAYGLSIVNPAVAGPFNLGTVVVRAAINVDPHSAALHIISDPLPTIIDGIPLQIQHVNVSVDREKFTFNPTDCNKMQVVGTLTSTEGAVSRVPTSFQVTNCATLAFRPKLTVSTAGKTSRTAGASLRVKLSYPAGPYDANIAKVKVDLPRQLPSRLTTLQKACPARTFEANPAACPPESIVGHAHATTPVLPVGLEGPAYFVSHAGEEFPDLIIVLQGYGTTVDLVGSTFIDNKTNVTSSTFKQIPDVPVGSFELTLPQGKYSALAAPKSLCGTKLTMPTAFVGQNGAELHQSTPITVTGCAKHTTKKIKTKAEKQSKAKKKP